MSLKEHEKSDRRSSVLGLPSLKTGFVSLWLQGQCATMWLPKGAPQESEKWPRAGESMPGARRLQSEIWRPYTQALLDEFRCVN